MKTLFYWITTSFFIGLIMGCSQVHDVSYFKKHPEEILKSALHCGKLKNDQEILKNPTCLAIAKLEEPACIQEEMMSGEEKFVPGIGRVSCHNKLYLIMRPIIDVRMNAILKGQPDPINDLLKQG